MENKKGEVWIVAEQDNGVLAEVSLELVCKGRELADRIGSSLGTIVMGNSIQHIPDELFSYGCDTVYLADHPELKHYTVLPYAKVI